MAGLASGCQAAIIEYRHFIMKITKKQAVTALQKWHTGCFEIFVRKQQANYTVSQKKTHQLWNGIAQNYKDRFWWHLAEIFKIPRNRVCMLQFPCRFAFFINFLSFKQDTEKNENCENYASHCLSTWHHSVKNTKFWSKFCMNVKVSTLDSL